MMLKVILYAAFLALGGIALVEDIATKRVRNRWILLGLACCLGVYAYLGLNTALALAGRRIGVLGESYLPLGFYAALPGHLLLSAAAAVVLWYLRIWPAGDAKLYILFAALLPLVDSNLRGFPSYLFLSMLVNIFVAAGIYVGALVLIEWAALLPRLSLFEIRESIKSTVSRIVHRLADAWPYRRRYAMVAWNTFALFVLMQTLRGFLRLPSQGVLGALAVYFALYLAWNPVCRLFVREDVAGVSFYLVSAVALPLAWAKGWGPGTSLMGGGRLTAGFYMFLSLARRIFEDYLERTRRVAVSVSALRPGMILSNDVWESLASLDSSEQASTLPDRYSDGVSDEDISSIRERLGQQAESTVNVYRSRPFALWIFAGSLWTMCQRKTVIEAILSALKHR